MRNIDSRIDELEKELSLMEEVYEIALRRVNGEDKDWERKRELLIDRMCRLIGQFKIEDQPSKAVAIVAQMMPWAAELTQQQRIVDDYVVKQRTLAALRGEQERRQDATEKARRAYEDQSWRKPA